MFWLGVIGVEWILLLLFVVLVGLILFVVESGEIHLSFGVVSWIFLVVLSLG